jgi:hypothetical protein
MTKSDKVLVLLLRFVGVGALFALVAVFMPLPWWWTASEGPGGVAFGVLLFFLARPGHSKTATP